MDKNGILQGNILIVDDTPANLRLLAQMLNTRGHRIRIAEDGPRALESVRANPPDLLLLDVMMPGMSGYEVCEQLRADRITRDIPIIFISALDNTQDKVNAFTVGGVDYITKPFQVEEVLARVETHLALRDLQKRLQVANSELEKANNELEQRVAVRTSELVELNAASQRFVPREILDLLNKPSVAEVELGDQVQQEMTILFSDICAFTARSEQMTPQASFSLLNTYLVSVTPVIRQHHGIVEQYLGDGVMALFSREADHAVQAAIAMQHAVSDYNRRLLIAGTDPLKVGIGLHTGNLMLGIIGDCERMQGTVISDSVYMAVRLEELCKDYGASIIASGPTIEQLADQNRYNHRLVDRVQLRGQGDWVSVFEIFDGEPDAVIELKNKTRQTLAQGLDLYYRGEFPESTVSFDSVLQQNPGDRIAQLHLRRSANAMRQLSADWDWERWGRGEIWPCTSR